MNFKYYHPHPSLKHLESLKPQNIFQQQAFIFSLKIARRSKSHELLSFNPFLFFFFSSSSPISCNIRPRRLPPPNLLLHSLAFLRPRRRSSTHLRFRRRWIPPSRPRFQKPDHDDSFVVSSPSKRRRRWLCPRSLQRLLRRISTFPPPSGQA